jgi:DnaK suppressor protein
VTPAELLHFKALLLQHRDALLAKDGAAIDPGNGELDRAGDDERPLNEMLQSIASTRNKNATQTSQRIHKALVRLEQRPDEFGLCASCEEEIEPRRLEAMPWVELCVECQDKENPRTRFTRKTLFDFIE